MKPLGFWKQLKKPIFALAPMEDVTDVAFRQMFARYGKPDVLFTEFVSADGLFRGGWDRLEHMLWYEDNERPIVAQIFSIEPEMMTKAAAKCVELGFDGIDINMGCPSNTVCKYGAGAAMIKTPDLAQEIIRATQEGAGDLPVTVKTRIGYDENQIEEWLPALLETDVPVVTLHARTRSDMSDMPAKWDVIAPAVEIRDEMESDTLIVGNGDITSQEEGYKRVAETGCDGVMIGRGAFGNPWFFNTEIERSDLPIKQRLDVMLEHTHLYQQIFGDTKNFRIMRKHFKAYAKGFPFAKQLRSELMQADTVEDVEQAVERFEEEYLSPAGSVLHVDS